MQIHIHRYLVTHVHQQHIRFWILVKQLNYQIYKINTFFTNLFFLHCAIKYMCFLDANILR